MNELVREFANIVMNRIYAWDEYENEPVRCIHCGTRVGYHHPSNIHIHKDGCPVIKANKFADEKILIIIRGKMPEVNPS